VAWSITSSASWLNVSPLTGSGSSIVSIEANDANNSGITRDETIQVTGDGTTYLVVVTQDFITAIQEGPVAAFQLYPNPTVNQLTIEINNSFLKNIQITSMSGIFIYNKEMEGTTYQIDLSSFKKGIYYITIRSKDFITTKKIIKL